MRYSLCSGINKYPDPQNWLKGCINDSIFWHFTATHRFAFNGRIINDSKVTIQNFSDEILHASSLLKENDWFLLTYSGHGSTLPDQNGDEIDGRDECLCLYDGFLRDDEMRKLFDTFKPGVNIVFISDSCHSGTNTREMVKPDLYRVPRYMIPHDKEFAEKAPTLPIKGRLLRSSTSEEDMAEILISGCKDTEYSYDAVFNGKNYGAMTYACMQVLNNAKQSITFEQFYSELRKQLPSEDYPQTPQFEGKAVNKKKMMFI